MSHRDNPIKKNKELSKPMDLMNVGFVGALGGGGSGIVATGGVEEIINGYTYRKFASSGTFAVTAGAGNLEVLIVGGGGGGGYKMAGGGGAGAIMISNPFALSQRNYTVTIGNGGAINNNGGSTVFDTETATGGGKGGLSNVNGGNGANGGGGGAGLDGHTSSYPSSDGGTGTAPTFSVLSGTVHAGYDGGDGSVGSNSAPAGGGGGATADGQEPASSGTTLEKRGAGGAGISIANFPTTLIWGGGGGGGNHGEIGGDGGTGSAGGGGGSPPTMSQTATDDQQRLGQSGGGGSRKAVGVLINSGSKLKGRKIKSFTCYKNSNSSVSGTVTAYVYNSSGSVVATSTNTNSASWTGSAIWNFDETYTMQTGDRLVIYYWGAGYMNIDRNNSGGFDGNDSQYAYLDSSDAWQVQTTWDLKMIITTSYASSGSGGLNTGAVSPAGESGGDGGANTGSGAGGGGWNGSGSGGTGGKGYVVVRHLE